VSSGTGEMRALAEGASEKEIAWLWRLLARFALRWRRALVAALLLATALAAPGVARLRPAWEADRFLPADHPALREFRRLERLGGLSEPLFAIIESDAPGREFELKYIAELFAQIASDPRFVERAEFRADWARQARHLDPDAPEFIHFLTAEDWDALAKRLSSESLKDWASEFRALASAGASPSTKRDDPLDLWRPVRERLFESIAPLRLTPRGRYFLSPDGRALAVILKPRRSAEDLFFSMRLLDYLSEAAEAALNSRELRRSFSIQFAGPWAETVREARALRFELARGLALGAALWLAFALAAFRRLAALFILGVPAACAGIVLAGAAGALWGSATLFGLSALALSVCAAGVFGVHLYSRYVEEAAVLGAPLERSVERALASAGPANAKLLALGAPAAALTAWTGQGDAWREFACLGAVGMALAWLMVHLGAPALTAIIVNQRSSRAVSRRFSNFGLRYLASAAALLPRLTLALAAMATFHLAWRAVQVEAFPGGLWGPLASAGRLDRPATFAAGGFRLPESRAVVAIESSDLQAALEASDRLYEALRRERGRLGIASILSTRTLLPSKRSQLASRERASVLDRDAIETRLREIARDAKLSEAEFLASALTPLRRLQDSVTTPPKEIAWGAIASARHNRLIRDRLKRPNGDRYLALTEIALERPPASADWRALAAVAAEAAPGSTLASRDLIADEALRGIRRDAAAAFLAIAAWAILWSVAALGGPGWAMLALGSATAALLAALGVIEMWGSAVGAPELFLAPPTLFLGFASIAHVIWRFRECRPQAARIVVLEESVYSPPQRAALFSAVHSGRPGSIAAIFFFLALAPHLPIEHEGLHRLAFAGMLSVVCFQLTAQALLPALLVLRETGLFLPSGPLAEEEPLDFPSGPQPAPPPPTPVPAPAPTRSSPGA
jgi:hypothetical protein